MTAFCSLLRQTQVNGSQTAWDGFRILLPLVPYLMQRGRAVVITERRVRSVAQQQSDHIQMAAISRSMERRGPTGRLRRRTRAVLKEKRAHGEVTTATSIVLKENMK